MSGEMLERLTLIMNNFFLLPENAHSEKAVIALLKAIREPTDQMIEAYNAKVAEFRIKKAIAPEIVWKAMIDQILGEGK